MSGAPRAAGADGCRKCDHNECANDQNRSLLRRADVILVVHSLGYPDWSICMASMTQVVLIDDLDGGPADETVRFGLSGAEYEIDLNGAHAGSLRQSLAEYMEAGRRVRGNGQRPLRRAARAAGATSSSDIREWAKAQGIEVRNRGRVPAELIVKFQAASEV
jgi:hypothetical protein